MTFKTYIYSMKILHLTLKKQWFDMIASGEKKEEYREIKPYWVKRLVESCGVLPDYELFNVTPLAFDVVRFRNGYAANSPSLDIECKGITVGVGHQKWGAPLNQVFIIQLGTTLTPTKQ